MHHEKDDVVQQEVGHGTLESGASPEASGRRLRQVTVPGRKESASLAASSPRSVRVQDLRPKRHSLQPLGGGQRKQALCRPWMERRREVWCRSFTNVSPSSVQEKNDDGDNDDDEEEEEDSEDDVKVHRPRCGGQAPDKREKSQTGKLLPAEARSKNVTLSRTSADSDINADVHDDNAEANSEYTRRLLMKRTSVPRLIHMKAIINDSPSTSMSSSELSSPHVETDASIRQCLLSGRTTAAKEDADTLAQLSGIDSSFGEGSDKSTDLSRVDSTPDGDDRSGQSFGAITLHNAPAGLPPFARVSGSTAEAAADRKADDKLSLLSSYPDSSCSMSQPFQPPGSYPLAGSSAEKGSAFTQSRHPRSPASCSHVGSCAKTRDFVGNPAATQSVLNAAEKSNWEIPGNGDRGNSGSSSGRRQEGRSTFRLPFVVTDV